jgi:hypothetical protein
MKAILEIEMPVKCQDCKLIVRESGGANFYCILTHDAWHVDSDFKSKNCPLKPVCTCNTCHDVGEITVVSGSVPENYDENNVPCPDCTPPHR